MGDLAAAAVKTQFGPFFGGISRRIVVLRDGLVWEHGGAESFHIGEAAVVTGPKGEPLEAATTSREENGAHAGFTPRPGMLVFGVRRYGRRGDVLIFRCEHRGGLWLRKIIELWDVPYEDMARMRRPFREPVVQAYWKARCYRCVAPHYAVGAVLRPV